MRLKISRTGLPNAIFQIQTTGSCCPYQYALADQSARLRSDSVAFASFSAREEVSVVVGQLAAASQ